MIVALLGIVVILYASILPKNGNEKSKAAQQEDFLDSVGETLQLFADELEEENKELLKMVGEMKREHESRANSLLKRIEQLEKLSSEPRPIAAATVPAPQATLSQQQVSPPEPLQRKGLAEALPEEKEAKPTRLASTIRERHKEVFELYDGGKSIEYIARKLGKNKGEIQLILSLARQEEPQHANT